MKYHAVGTGGCNDNVNLDLSSNPLYVSDSCDIDSDGQTDDKWSLRNTTLVSGVVLLSLEAPHGTEVRNAQFYLDGELLGGEITGPEISISLNTTLISNGRHTLKANVRVLSGNVLSYTPITLIVANNPPGFWQDLDAGFAYLVSGAQVAFPDEIVFSLRAVGGHEVEVIELEYVVATNTYESDVNHVVLENLESSNLVDTAWTWDMHHNDSLPPGARLWWRWRLVDAAGREVRTEKQWLTWLDDVHPWQRIQEGNITLHWYAGTENFAEALLAAARASQTRLRENVVIPFEDEVDIYIYGTVGEVREVILSDPGWTGGLAYPDQGVVVIGIDEENLEWGLGAIAHEMAHVIVRSTFGFDASSLPSWLDEGLAAYAEGELDPVSRGVLEDAITNNKFFSTRSLSDGLVEDNSQGYLSHAQSYSLVAYLIESWSFALQNCFVS